MYTWACLPHMQEKVLSSFSTAGSKLRLVVATTAFNMGIDCAVEYITIALQVVLNSMCKKQAGLDVMAYCHKPSCCMASLEGLQKRKYNCMVKTRLSADKESCFKTLYAIIMKI